MKEVQVSARLEPQVVSGPRWWWTGLQLACLAFFVPLSRLSGPQRALTNPISALMVGGAVTVLGILLYLIFKRFAKTEWRALALASTCLVFFWQWGAWASRGTLVSWAASMALLVVVLLAVRRIADHQLFRKAVLMTSVTLSGTALVLIGVDMANAAPPSVQVEGIPELGAPVGTPDVILVVLDSYARADVLQDDFSFDNSDFLSTLRESGFEVADSANANYTMTHLSMPSLLSMGYLDSPLGEIGHSDLRLLESMTSGENPVVESFRQAGYAYVHGSADNWLNHCSEVADLCLPGPAIDQTTFALLSETPVGPLLHPTSGDPTTALNRQRIDQLQNWDELSAEVSDRPTFTYLHLGLPHPPLFLDSECEPRVHHNLGGQLINFLSMSPEIVELRKDAYVDQVICANSTVLAFLDQLEGNEIVVVTSDHGPDSHGLLNADPETWSQQQIHERLGTLTALKLPADCPARVDQNLQLVNVFRVVLGCLYPNADLPLLESEYRATTFGGPIIPLDDPDGPAG